MIEGCYTEEGYRKLCGHLMIGQRVIVHQRKLMADGKSVQIGKKRAVIAGKYPHIISVRYDDGFTASFRYPDVVREGILEPSWEAR